MFPEKVGRFVLDGIVYHGQTETDGLITESSTYESVLKQFFKWCETEKTCTLGKNAQKTYEDVVKMADKEPIPAPGCLKEGPTACADKINGEQLISKLH